MKGLPECKAVWTDIASAKLQIDHPEFILNALTEFILK